MRLLTTIFAFVVISTLSSVFAQSAYAQDEKFAREIRDIFQQTCFQCHGSDDQVEGDVNLLAIKSANELQTKPELIENLIEVLDSRSMPPEDSTNLTDQDRTRLIAELRKQLHAAIQLQASYPQTPIRRMNRFQYNNAVMDLFKLNRVVFALPERMLRDYNYFDPASGKMPKKLKAGSRPLGKSQLIEPRLANVGAFPQDLRAEHGFDNRGDHLSLSPMLMESFLQLSRSVVESPDFIRKNVGVWDSFFAKPESNQDFKPLVRQRMRRFLTRAFRRPVSDEILSRYSSFVISRIESGEPFSDAMKVAASAVIASPRFLYLFDRSNQTDAVERLDDFELASRLSFFLWGSIPDEKLLKVAASGKLLEPETLSRQVDRMLNNKKLKRFCDSFPTQWLQLERIISSAPDLKQHPQFYFTKFKSSMHMMLEPLLLFECILIEDRSIIELIDSDFSYRSALLKNWYASGKRGNQAPPKDIPFERVPVTDRRQGGVITNAAVMTMTSNATDSKPITRGAWMLTVIFNTPPEPPPADVPALSEEKTDETKDLTIRELFAEHRVRADCASCHVKIDPLGFALENYGPTGIWRDEYENGRSVDASGELFRKHKFADAVGLKDAILNEKDRFARGFAKHLLAFSLGREVTAYDTPSLDTIVERTIANEYKMRSLIKEIVMSDAFLQKFNPTK